MYLVECKPDEALVRSLTKTSKKQINHAGNKPELLKKLVKHHANSVGVIDEDPASHQPPLLRSFTLKEELRKYEFKVLFYRKKNNTLIILCPKLEDWILKAAREAHIDVTGKYRLPNDVALLHEEINFRMEQFQKLLKELKIRSERVKALGKRLRSFKV